MNGGQNKPNVWVIGTDSVGELHARVGIAQKINPDYSIAPIQGKGLEEIRSYYENEFGTNRLKNNEKWPDFVVSSGIRSTQAARAIKRLSGNHTFIIQSLDPKENYNAYDLIAIPDHLMDEGQKKRRNIIGTIGVPHAVTDEKIEAAKIKWKDQFSSLGHPIIAVMLGGNTREFEFTPDRAREMARQLNAKAQELGASLVISTSRRTDDSIATAFMEEITVPTYVHDWRLSHDKENPYLGILGLSDAIVVTGDSMSMCCEANMSEKPVYIYGFEENRVGIRKLHERLYSHNLAKPFQALLDHGIEHWDYTPLDTAGFVAEEAIRRWRELQPKQQSATVIDHPTKRIIRERTLAMANGLLTSSMEGISSMHQALNQDTHLQNEFFRAVEMINKAQGRILITGVGKSLRVGELVAASFGSLGIPCEILDPTHAIHGDLGKMDSKAGDTIIAISKSGNSEELNPVIEEARERGLNIISITHNAHSQLGKAAKDSGKKGVLLTIPAPNEPHPFMNEEGTKISPPTVTTSQVKMLLESIGLSVAQLRGMNVEKFTRNHPAGALGKAGKAHTGTHRA
ncbi:MAG: ELM1/GtrOC1 family putative glycosyltransferase [Rickettsiales bacterium]|nr:ELM1/GtrOC1 family putative glycosyltransferase [Rickettsiales bacterium]